jgi:hypothetical protein
MKESNQAVDDFEKLRGQDALDAQAGLKQKLDEIHDHYVGGLGPKDKLLFDNSYRNYQYRYLNGKIDTHATSQGHEFATKTNNDTQALAIDTAAKNFNNPDVVEYQRHVARDAAVKQLHIDGMDRQPGNVQEQLRRVDTAIYKGVAEAMYVHDPQGAMKYVEAHRGELGAAYAPLADQFRNRSETVTAETRAEVLQKINGTADPAAKKSIADANKAVLGDEIYKSMFPDQGEAPKSNVVPIKPPAETPPDQAKRLLEEEKKKTPAQPAPGAKDELGRIGGQGASIQVPFQPLMATAQGRAQLIEQGLKTYQPGTKLTSTFGSFTIPPAGSSFQYEGKTYTVPVGKPGNPTLGGYSNKLGGLEPGQKPPAPGETDTAAVAKAISATPATPGAVADISAVSGIPAGHKMEHVNGMIIHHSGGDGTVFGLIHTLKQRGLSAQFAVDRDGKTYQLVPDGTEAHHIMNGWGPLGEGKSNRNMQGVEVIARDNKDVTPAQIKAVQGLVARQAQKYGYDPATSVFGHGEVNPGHKEADEGMSSVNLIRGQQQQATQ